MAQDETEQPEHTGFPTIRAWLKTRPFRGPDPLEEDVL